MVASCCLKQCSGVAVVIYPSCQTIWWCRAKTEGNWPKQKGSAPSYGCWMGLLTAQRQGRRDRRTVMKPPWGGGVCRCSWICRILWSKDWSSRFMVPRAPGPPGLNLELTWSRAIGLDTAGALGWWTGRNDLAISWWVHWCWRRCEGILMLAAVRSKECLGQIWYEGHPW